jgi:hypothetical protein
MVLEPRLGIGNTHVAIRFERMQYPPCVVQFRDNIRASLYPIAFRLQQFHKEVPDARAEFEELTRSTCCWANTDIERTKSKKTDRTGRIIAGKTKA